MKEVYRTPLCRGGAGVKRPPAGPEKFGDPPPPFKEPSAPARVYQHSSRQQKGWGSVPDYLKVGQQATGPGRIRNTELQVHRRSRPGRSGQEVPGSRTRAGQTDAASQEGQMKLFWLLAIIGGIFFIEGTVSVVIGGFSGSIAGLGLATGGFLRCLIGGIAPFSLIPIIPT